MLPLGTLKVTPSIGKTFSPKEGGSLAVIVTVFNELQPKKALSLISLTFSGISICFKAVQSKKACSSLILNC